MRKILLLTALPIVIVSGLFITFNMQEIGSKFETQVIPQNNSDIIYSIDNDLSSYDSQYSERGIYYDTLDQPNAPHFYFIAMGEKSTGGYSINIETVNIDKKGNVEVIVKELSEQFPGAQSDVMTYPTCKITLNKLPNTIIVKNTEGKLFKNIDF